MSRMKFSLVMAFNTILTVVMIVMIIADLRPHH